MRKEKTKFDPREILPQNLIIKSAATHLYRTGLSLFPYDSVHRNRYHNPLFIFILILQFFMRCVISLLLSDDDKYISMILGDWSHLLNVRVHFNICASLVISIPLVSQIIHYYNFKNDIKPSYLKPFEMMSGLCSPQSIGLTNEADIYKMLRLSKMLFRLRDFLSKIVMPIVGILVSFVPFSLNYSFRQFIIFGVPNIFLWIYYLYYMYNIIISQIIYFHIICFYLF